MKNAVIFDIQRNSYVDSPGIRTTVFFKGCNLRCEWCHNPESQKSERQLMFYADRCIKCGMCKKVCPNGMNSCTFCGKCTLYCPCDAREVSGKEYTVYEVLKNVLRDKPYYDSSSGGVTFSGGECMLQIDFLEEILKACKKNDIHTAVDTAGCVPFERFERILPYTDLFLYDVKCFDAELHEKYTGVRNELILENLRKLLKSDVKVWVRIPVIPSFNDFADEMTKIKIFLDSCGASDKVELLPYHSMGEYKYTALGLKERKFEIPDVDKMLQLKTIFI